MITNKIVSLLISITGIVVIPVQIVTTFVLGLLVSLTFGLLLIPLSAIWIVVFYCPLLGLSFIWENIAIIRPFISIIGIPLAVLGNTFVAIVPSMGEFDSRFSKMVLCQTFPYTWRFNKYSLGKLKLNDDDVLNNILKEVSVSTPLREYLGKIK